MAEFELTSAAFDPGDAVPSKYTCEGENVSPPLAWSPPPEGTRSLALIMDDPDAPAGTFTIGSRRQQPEEVAGCLSDCG
jgi:phosphatidylethanolamine-binding protein (PEBP) family uncharacterized protein